MSKHTPGPWQIKINVSSACVLDGKGALLARLLLGDHFNDRVVANARLMHSAPELLSVCKELAASAAYWGDYDVPLSIVDRLNAAIAKAEGI